MNRNVKSVTVYTTSDGKKWRDEKSAVNWERQISIEDNSDLVMEAVVEAIKKSASDRLPESTLQILAELIDKAPADYTTSPGEKIEDLMLNYIDQMLEILNVTIPESIEASKDPGADGVVIEAAANKNN
jgi:hypothetical protein